MRRRSLLVLAAVLMTVPVPVVEANPGRDMVLWYDEPAPDTNQGWETRSLPIGNGAMGATVFGGVQAERLQFNEKTLWTGGPGVSDYNYGNWSEPRPGALEAIRQRVINEGQVKPEDVLASLGLKSDTPRHRRFGAYQSFGDLRLAFPHTQFTDYRRELDISRGTAKVSYVADSVRYTREYFATAKDDVLVARISADRPGKITMNTRIQVPANRTSTVAASKGRITVTGALASNGLRYETQAQVNNQGGSRTDNADGSVSVAGANEVTLVLAAGTDYANDYPKYRGDDPHKRVTLAVNSAQRKSFGILQFRHVADYQELFGRVSLNLGGRMPDVPTDDVLAAYGTDAAADRALEQLFFAYGRYLLIASSRPGSLPANLQGVWNVLEAPPWQADYHLNINIQMNYFPADTTNLAETAEPFAEYVDSLREPGRVTARDMYGVKQGWVAHHASNIYGWTGAWDHPAYFFPESGAWLSDQLYDHYRFTLDSKYLATKAYPVMKETAQFWLEFLQTDPKDGKLVALPSRSPEIGPHTAGASMSQQILWLLFTDVLEAAKIVGDKDFAARATEVLGKLDPGLRVGKWGQLQEWKADIDDPNETHRHVSHMFALHPGKQVSPRTTPELAEAAKVSLNARTDAGTGWSKAWKINFWARLLDGDRAHKLLADQLKTSTLPNLWDTHPPFQIDGNFGATAGATEMLLQSHLGAIDVLPAVPRSWPDGRVDGLRARGDVTVGVTWQSGAPTQIRLLTGKGDAVKVRSSMFRNAVRVFSQGQLVPHTTDGDVLSFATRNKGEYLIVPVS
ncbi:glycoside hydrolase family 95 protein [Kibdelosporangium philippinense]|uniref:Glycoside hydrolase family 95 protein n=1 Tax=Kibdelosporangium philippinense TaxID=211113 RepID=A0ABS8ZFR2_9PSEU|nr:glycoside hydrolase family 95 protein [Kibdelosporangium philippinense]MCE7006666.1 glycoside hydrolase family 95 protein [Kibdelosporangium philippinense]